MDDSCDSAHVLDGPSEGQIERDAGFDLCPPQRQQCPVCLKASLAECQDIEKVDGAFAILDLRKAQCFTCILGSCLDIACAVAQRLDIIQPAFDIGIGVQHRGPVIGEGNAPVRFSRINARRGQTAIKQRSSEPDAEGEGERRRIDEVAKV